MSLVNITGFQRARRLMQAAEAAEAKTEVTNTNGPTEPENPGAGQNEPPNEDPKVLTDDAIDAMEIDELKAELEKLEITFAHNTGEAKLREKLKDAING